MRFSVSQWALAVAVAALAHALLALGLFLLPPRAGLFARDATSMVVSLASIGESPLFAPTAAPAAAPVQAIPPSRAPLEAVIPAVPTPEHAAGTPLAPVAAQAIQPQVVEAVIVRPTTEVTAVTATNLPVTQSLVNDQGDRANGQAIYIGHLRNWLARHQEYPRRAREQGLEGTVRLYLVVDREGRVLEYRILPGSGHPALDQAAEQMLKQATPLPAMPDSLLRNRLELIIPVVFELRQAPAEDADR